MPRMENMCTHDDRSRLLAAAPAAADPAAEDLAEPGTHSRTGSFSNLARLPVTVAKAKLQPFVRFIGDKDCQDENDIYRKNTSDAVFTFERWSKHRDSFRYAKHLAHMFSSRVFRSLLGPVCAVMLLALLVGVYETLVDTHGLDHWPHVTLALGQGFNLTAFALSLLLVFRTNSSYDRWWEGRKLWGGAVNRCRDFVRQSLVFFRDEDVHLRELLARWTMAFPFVLMCHLRENSDVAKETEHILTAPEMTALLAAAHRPNFVLQMMAEIVRAARPTELARLRMDENLTFFHDCMGSMERILRTPIPLSYTRHTSRFLLVWLIMLPFTLWAAYSWFSVLLSGIFAFLMFGIDEIGVQIEEPFGILPLEAISATIERNIRELMARNFEVTNLVRQANLCPTTAPSAPSDSRGGAAAGSPAARGAGNGGSLLGSGGSDAATVVALSGEEDGFGEMMAAGADGPPGGAAGGKAGAPAGNLISLTASASEAAAPPPVQAGQRRVHFGATVIDVGGSSDGGGPRELTRRASLAEVELAQGASPVISPRDKRGGSSYGGWLND